MFYVHPWEVDPHQPRVAASGAISRWRHCVNLHTTESKLENLLRRFRFGTLSESIAADRLAVPAAASGLRTVAHGSSLSARP
jgi:hypothetical protein